MNEIDRIKAMSDAQIRELSDQYKKEVVGYFVGVTVTKVAILLITRAAIKRYWKV